MYRAVHKPGPKATELVLEVIEIDPPRRIVWRQTDEAGTLIVSYDLDALSAERTSGLVRRVAVPWPAAARSPSTLIHRARSSGTLASIAALVDSCGLTTGISRALTRRFGSC